jgi:hypothetical protein
MSPAGVVPTLYPGEDCQPCLGLVLPAAPGNQHTLQAGKEALGHSVVIGIAHGSHGWAYAHFLATVAKGNTGVLGGFNRSSQHFQHGGVYGTTRRMDEAIAGGEMQCLSPGVYCLSGVRMKLAIAPDEMPRSSSVALTLNPGLDSTNAMPLAWDGLDLVVLTVLSTC